MTRLKPSPAMVVAFIALIVSLTSGAYAAVRITTNNIADRAVTHNKLADNAVWNRSLGRPAVRTANINNGAVTHRKLSANAVWNVNLGRPAVRTVNINDGAVTHPKLANDAVERNNVSPDLLSQLQGATGPQGPKGTIASVVTRDRVVRVPAGGTANAVQSCDAGEVVVGGLARPLTDGDPSLTVTTSRPARNNAGNPPANGTALFGWFGSASNRATTTHGMVVSAFCGQP